MIGVDLVKIERLENKSDHFVRKILSLDEYELYQKTKAKAIFLATRWAIKEALFKADNQHFCFKKINITKKDNVYKFDGFAISVSSEKEYVIAFVQKIGVACHRD
ncbi:holo-ACP synthase [Mycoplasmopsis pulmonis]|nr:4'-phosphopantetheinyl transferase superfamily protein [Mycoplasmopsis pulmonis]MDZ7293083.1 4'-phosphopantetheinyl transferase superfamily protein [Mycoplasmopsis pulmonis]VEU67876.1 Holo-[acyl-carrier protein]synthase [Mycoplasmopsis pulmonis]